MNIDKNKLVVLAILDGFGITTEKEGNAIHLAKKPNLKSINDNYLGTLLRASGNEVGLTWGEMGNSEVGHLNIGSGLVVYQNLFLINSSIKEGTFNKIATWKNAVDHAEKNNSDLHLIGLLSNGGVHSHMDHLFALLETIKELNFKGKTYIHVIGDGRDTPSKVLQRFLEILNTHISKTGVGEIASVSGRYYAMDRNENWSRTKEAYDAMVGGSENKSSDINNLLEKSYDQNINDEFIKPTTLTNEKKEPRGLIKDNDSVIFFNFRPDRARQLSEALSAPKFDKFNRKDLKNLFFATMADYGLNYPVNIAFSKKKIADPLAKIISDSGKKQFHIAETEKYAHVTYFLDGGEEVNFPNEDKVLIPSKDVKSFDEKPEMSAPEITDRSIKEIEGGKYDFIVINFANADMVGHTGNLEAGIKAVEVLDKSIGKIRDAVLKVGGTLIITADHGNIEEMINLSTNKIDKEHSTNPVPFWIINSKTKKIQRDSVLQTEPGGILADVAPTIIELMGLKKPVEMTGLSLLNVITENPILPD